MFLFDKGSERARMRRLRAEMLIEPNDGWLWLGCALLGEIYHRPKRMRRALLRGRELAHAAKDQELLRELDYFEYRRALVDGNWEVDEPPTFSEWFDRKSPTSTPESE